MKRQLSNTIYGLKFAMEKNDFERLKSSSGKNRNDFVANPIGLGFAILPCIKYIQDAPRGGSKRDFISLLFLFVFNFYVFSRLNFFFLFFAFFSLYK